MFQKTIFNKASATITTDKNDLKVNKPVYIAKLRQRYYKILNNILLHAPNHALKDEYMLSYGTMKNTNSLYYTRLLFCY